MYAEEVEKSSEKFDIYSIDIAPANDKVIYSDFSDTGLFVRKSEERSDESSDEKNDVAKNKIEFIEKSFDQVSFLYLLSYMPDPILRFQEYFTQLRNYFCPHPGVPGHRPGLAIDYRLSARCVESGHGAI